MDILSDIFSENKGDMVKKDEAFMASAELIKKVLSRARIKKGVIYFSFPKKICEKKPTLPKYCAIKLKPGIPTKHYIEWVG